MSAPLLIKKRKTDESECETPSSRIAQGPSPMAGDLFADDGFRICRICLEPSSSCGAEEGKGASLELQQSAHPAEDQLVSPCGCTGTQAYVHLRCLRRWQIAVMSSRHPGANYAPALICSVCTKRFSFAPPKPALSMRLSGILDCYAREVAALIIFLCSCYVALAYHYNIRPILYQADAKLTSFAAFIKYGPPSHDPTLAPLGLRSGVVLVASPDMRPQQSVFYQSVVLIFEHGRRGSVGVILNKPKAGEDLARVKTQLPSQDLNGLDSELLVHGTGGPVHPHELMLLRRCSPVRFRGQGCCSCGGGSGGGEPNVIGPSPGGNDDDVGVAAGSSRCAKPWGQEVVPGLCLGADLKALQQQRRVRKLVLGMGAVEAEADDGNGLSGEGLWHGERSDDGGGNEQRGEVGVGSVVCGCGEDGSRGEGLMVLHGRAKWSEGQLEGEIGRGFWTTRNDLGSRLLTLPLQDLWEALVQN